MAARDDELDDVVLEEERDDELHELLELLDVRIHYITCLALAHQLFERLVVLPRQQAVHQREYSGL